MNDQSNDQLITETDRSKSYNNKSTSSAKKEKAIKESRQKTSLEPQGLGHSDNPKPEPKKTKI